MNSNTSTPPLKSKLSHIKLLLDDANQRLRDEAEIFTTKASAASMANQNGHSRQKQQQHLAPAELRRTIADISTIQSVLSCPIFSKIANVTDSLDKLTYHLNLRPSIGPEDIEFDQNGELVLAPPVEPTTLNNLINSQLDEYSNSPDSPLAGNPMSQLINNTILGPVGQTAPHNANLGIEQHQFNSIAQQQHDVPKFYSDYAKFQQQQFNNEMLDSPDAGARLHAEPLACKQNLANQQQQPQQQRRVTTSIPSSTAQQQQQQLLPRRSEYDTEKLLGADAGQTNHANGARRPPTKVQAAAAMFESAFSAANEANQGLYKANGHSALNQMAAQNSADIRMDFETTRSMSQINEQSMDSESLGYTNNGAAYKKAHEVASADNMVSSEPNAYDANGSAHSKQHAEIAGGKSANEIAAYGKRASPSTSAGSNARLADECDSGTSSFRSKGALYSPHSQRPIEQLPDDDPIDSSIDQELIEKLSPEMERIKVTLEKDSSGLGITIAGYMCEQEEISGIFIKSITPGSPADRSGKIRVLDQIFAVNGQEILGFSNPQAVNVLRQQSRVVTLDLMRYLAESKYKKLQTLLEHAAPSPSLQKASAGHNMNLSSSSDMAQQTKAQPVVSTSSPKLVDPPPAAAVTAQVQQQQQRQRQQQTVESMYNNSAAFADNKAQKPHDGATSPMPVAAQRTATTTGPAANRIIETKQGARNKIDIKSPLTATTPATAATMATYANEIPNSHNSSGALASNSGGAFISDSSTPKGPSVDRLMRGHEWTDDLSQQLEKLEWAKSVQIVELRREFAQSLGFTIKDYANPENPQQSIFMIVSITPGGIADQSGQLSIGDLLKFVDDTNLENSSLSDAVKALRRTSDQVRLGILKYMRN